MIFGLLKQSYFRAEVYKVYVCVPADKKDFSTNCREMKFPPNIYKSSIIVWTVPLLPASHHAHHKAIFVCQVNFVITDMLYARALSDRLIFYEKEINGS